VKFNIGRAISFVGNGLYFFIEPFLPSTVKVMWTLSLKPRNDFIHPHKLKTLTSTVDFSDQVRFDLIGRSRRSTIRYASVKSIFQVEEAIKGLVKNRRYKRVFSMSQLHGAISSKSFGSEKHASRIGKKSMADMGGEIHDLKDLEGLKGDNIIEACKGWAELRLYDGVVLFRNNLYDRYYWANDGGSHHMAVLCYQLVKQEKEWEHEVTVDDKELCLESIRKMDHRFKMYLFPSILDNSDSSPIHLPEGLNNETIGFMSFTFPNDKHYELFVVDLKTKYSPYLLSLFNREVEQRKAMPFYDFIEAFIAVENNHLEEQ
jgi:hypothetical protein